MNTNATKSHSVEVSAGAEGPFASDEVRRESAAINSPGSTQRAAVRGSFWVIVGSVIKQGSRLVTNILLSRLLFPEAFGLMALVNVVTRGVEMFSDLGIGLSMIQNPRGDEPRFRNTAWTLQVIRGMVLWMLACLLARPFSSFYGEPLVLWLIPVAGVIAAVSGFNSTSLFTLRRHLRIRTLTVIDVSSHLVGILTMIVWAYISPSVWALLSGALVATVFRMICSHVLNDGTPNCFCWDRESVDSILRFGKWIFLSTIITFFAMQGDRLLLGKLIPVATLGVYSVAAAIARMPNTLLAQLCSRILLPVLSKAAWKSPETMSRRLHTAREGLLAVGVAMVLSVSLVGDLFFRTLYDARYHAAGPMSELMAAWAWATILSTTLSRALVALGDSRSVAAFNMMRLVGTVVATLIGFQLAGIEGFIVGMAIGALCGQAVILYRLGKHGIHVVGQDIRYTLWLVGLAAVSHSIVNVSGTYWPGAKVLVTLTILTTIAACATVKVRQLMRQ